MAANNEELQRTCANCNYSHPAEPYESEFAICLKDPDLEPFLDDILARQDFSGCRGLVRRKRFDWEREACEHFDPMEDIGTEIPDSPELIAELRRLGDAGKLTPETLQQAILTDAFDRIDWSQKPVDDYFDELRKTKTLASRRKVVRRFGFLIGQGNRAAFTGLCQYLRDLGPASTLDDKHLRIEILEQLRFARDASMEADLARLLVDDLFRTPSNNITRGWYTAVFNYFKRWCPPEIAEDALRRMLDSRHFSYRIRRRVQGILDREEDWDLF